MTDNRLFAGLHALGWHELADHSRGLLYLVDAENPTAGVWIALEPTPCKDAEGRPCYRAAAENRQAVGVYRHEIESGRQIVFSTSAGIIAEGRQKGELE